MEPEPLDAPTPRGRFATVHEQPAAELQTVAIALFEESEERPITPRPYVLEAPLQLPTPRLWRAAPQTRSPVLAAEEDLQTCPQLEPLPKLPPESGWLPLDAIDGAATQQQSSVPVTVKESGAVVREAHSEDCPNNEYPRNAGQAKNTTDAAPSHVNAPHVNAPHVDAPHESPRAISAIPPNKTLLEQIDPDYFFPDEEAGAVALTAAELIQPNPSKVRRLMESLGVTYAADRSSTGQHSDASRDTATKRNVLPSNQESKSLVTQEQAIGSPEARSAASATNQSTPVERASQISPGAEPPPIPKELQQPGSVARYFTNLQPLPLVGQADNHPASDPLNLGEGIALTAKSHGTAGMMGPEKGTWPADPEADPGPAAPSEIAPKADSPDAQEPTAPSISMRLSDDEAHPPRWSATTRSDRAGEGKRAAPQRVRIDGPDNAHSSAAVTEQQLPLMGDPQPNLENPSRTAMSLQPNTAMSEKGAVANSPSAAEVPPPDVSPVEILPRQRPRPVRIALDGHPGDSRHGTHTPTEAAQDGATTLADQNTLRSVDALGIVPQARPTTEASSSVLSATPEQTAASDPPPAATPQKHTERPRPELIRVEPPVALMLAGEPSSATNGPEQLVSAVTAAREGQSTGGEPSSARPATQSSTSSATVQQNDVAANQSTNRPSDSEPSAADVVNAQKSPAGNSHAENSHAENSHAENSHAENSHAENSRAGNSDAGSSVADNSPAKPGLANWDSLYTKAQSAASLPSRTELAQVPSVLKHPRKPAESVVAGEQGERLAASSVPTPTSGSATFSQQTVTEERPAPAGATSVADNRLPNVDGLLTHRQMEVTLRQASHLHTNYEVTRIQVLDPAICEVVQFSAHELAFIGKRPGSTHVRLWFKDQGHATNYRITVRASELTNELEPPLEKLQTLLSEMFPDAQIEIFSQGERIVVRGTATSNDEALKIVSLVRKLRLVPVVDQIQVKR
jgi:hypothetical protein